MGALENLLGRTFEHLLVEERVGSDRWGSALWQCWCLCGSVIVVTAGRLKSGHTTSCGCLSSRVTVGERSRTHGEAPRGRATAEHRIWAAMLTRCYNENVRSYHRYGGRGITVCDRWRTSYENFLVDMGRRPGPGYSIERKKNNEGYSKDNCEWATTKTQARNKSTTRRVTYAGREMCIGELAEITGQSYPRLWTRIVEYGWAPERAAAAIDYRRKDYARDAA